MSTPRKRGKEKAPDETRPPGKVRFQIFGEEMIEKKVKRGLDKFMEAWLTSR